MPLYSSWYMEWCGLCSMRIFFKKKKYYGVIDILKKTVHISLIQLNECEDKLNTCETSPHQDHKSIHHLQSSFRTFLLVIHKKIPFYFSDDHHINSFGFYLLPQQFPSNIKNSIFFFPFQSKKEELSPILPCVQGGSVHLAYI